MKKNYEVKCALAQQEIYRAFLLLEQKLIDLEAFLMEVCK